MTAEVLEHLRDARGVEPAQHGELPHLVIEREIERQSAAGRRRFFGTLASSVGFGFPHTPFHHKL